MNNEILQSTEIKNARLHLLCLAQKQSYDDVFEALRHQKSLPKGHSLARKDIFLDCNKLLKVRSRVRDMNTPTQVKSFIPLSLKSELTRLLVKSLHKTYSHPGISALLSILGDTYHIPGLRNYLKKVSRQCATCQRAYAKPLQQQMGLLPSARTTPAPPFCRTRVDYAGPFYIRKGHTRKPVHVKYYACLFVCMTIRTVHLELCSELSTAEFMAALRRFTARRGTPAHMYSDNGTNFLGAHQEIKELQRFHHSSETRSSISHFCTTSNIEWHFIPPRAPHFGGLWEAGVRGMKLLLRKLITPHPLRFDELYTVLTEAESVLNSRPITSLNSTDVDNMTLTSGHFLIGRPLKAPPTSEPSQAQLSSLRRWTLVSRLSQDLWKYWMKLYLQSIRYRTKWINKHDNIRKNDVVFVKDEILKYRDWPLARIVEVYPGDDGNIRTVDLRCHGKVYRCSIHRIIPFINHDEALKTRQTSSDSPQDVQDSRSPEQA